MQHSFSCANYFITNEVSDRAVLKTILYVNVSVCVQVCVHVEGRRKKVFFYSKVIKDNVVEKKLGNCHFQCG